MDLDWLRKWDYNWDWLFKSNPTREPIERMKKDEDYNWNNYGMYLLFDCKGNLSRCGISNNIGETVKKLDIWEHETHYSILTTSKKKTETDEDMWGYLKRAKQSLRNIAKANSE